LFAPEQVKHRPSGFILSLNENLAGLHVHVMVNSNEESGTQVTPVGKWVAKGDIVYLHQQENLEVNKRSGLRLPRDVCQNQGAQNLLPEAYLVNDRQSAPSLAMVAKAASTTALKLYRKLKQIEQQQGKLAGAQAQTLLHVEALKREIIEVCPVSLPSPLHVPPPPPAAATRT
jgi:hypothetical protein